MKIQFFYTLIFVLSVSILQATTYEVTFQMKANIGTTDFGIRGSIAPLSWEKSIPLYDKDGDGIYTATVTFETTATNLAYKYISNEKSWELRGDGNRTISLIAASKQPLSDKWNEFPPLSSTEKATLTFSKKQLLEDFKIMKEAYLSLHPSLYRYSTKEEIAANFDALEQKLQQERSLEEAYLAFGEFITAIKCGHTYLNHWNQKTIVKRAFHYQNDKLPFTFKLVDKRMVMWHNVSGKAELDNVEITAINGIGIGEIITSLMPYINADGANDGQRLYHLQLNGIDKFEFFDIYFPILFPPNDGTYNITYNDIKANKTGSTTVKTISRTDRKERLQNQIDGFIKNEEETWKFEIVDNNLAVLSIGTFSIWNFEMDYKKFLEDAFRQIKEQKINNLVLDIRHNGGGADEVIKEIANYIIKEKITLEGDRTILKYNKVPENLRPYLSTWDKSFYDISKKVKPMGNGNYTWKNSREKGIVFNPKKTPYKFEGDFYLIAHAANSSATFYLTKMVKEAKLGTVVGQETGGNQKGITGGFMFFLTLPNTQIEMDIPLGAQYPLTEKPDGGIQPNIYVQPSIEDAINGIDTELETIKEIIKTK